MNPCNCPLCQGRRTAYFADPIPKETPMTFSVNDLVTITGNHPLRVVNGQVSRDGVVVEAPTGGLPRYTVRLEDGSAWTIWAYELEARRQPKQATTTADGRFQVGDRVEYLGGYPDNGGLKPGTIGIVDAIAGSGMNVQFGRGLYFLYPREVKPVVQPVPTPSRPADLDRIADLESALSYAKSFAKGNRERAVKAEALAAKLADKLSDVESERDELRADLNNIKSAADTLRTVFNFYQN